MRTLLIFLFSLITIFGFGQSVTAPEPKSFAINTANQDASGFSLSGFNSTATLLCAIGLPTAPSGTTFNMTRFDGLTPASGFNFSGNKTRLVFTGTMANINIALATLRVNTTATAGNIQISVSATVNPTGYFYNPTNGHFYRPISTGANYLNAITLSANQTFKGQTGYLVTITSADEDAFIFNNVPQANIWFALDDRATEGRWVISAGPEVGTLLNIGNYNANPQPNTYRNWAGGEPNDWGGNEDAAVTKWGGGSQWNDLSTANVNPYVVEFGTWTNPDDQTFTEFVSNSVIHSNGNTLRAQFTFNFGSNVDETKFKSKIITSTDDVTYNTNNALVTLNGIGRVDLTNQIDTVMISGTGNKATIGVGQAEFSYVNISNGTTTLYIDLSRFGATQPSSINSVSILDVYNGPVTYQQTSTYWAHYIVPSTLTKVTDGTSSFNSSIRNAGYNNWAFMSNITFAQNTMNKYHKISMDIQQSDLLTLLGSAVTVGDVYLAFREFADRGILGDESKYFTSGIQFHNADVNDDGVFDERDCYALLTHLQGTTSLWNNPPALGDIMKIVTSTAYDNITKQNWNTYTGITRYRYPFTFTNGTLNSYNLDIAWKGDVNLSHSAQPANTNITNSVNSMSIKTMSITSEPTAYIISQISGDSLVATIRFNPNSNPIVGTQFQINYDNSILSFSGAQFKTSGSPTNFSTNKGTYINLGSLNTGGETLDGVTEYRLTFKTKQILNNSLGLISIANNEGVTNSGKTIKIKIQ